MIKYFSRLNWSWLVGKSQLEKDLIDLRSKYIEASKITDQLELRNYVFSNNLQYGLCHSLGSDLYSTSRQIRDLINDYGVKFELNRFQAWVQYFWPSVISTIINTKSIQDGKAVCIYPRIECLTYLINNL